MNSLIVGVLCVSIIGLCTADTPTPSPFVGDWNYTYSPHDRDSKLCMKLKAGIRLDISYETHNGTKIATINSTDNVIVGSESQCQNLTAELNEKLALKFNRDRTLFLYFTRDGKITQDESKNRWQLYKVEFTFQYDSETFPDSLETGNDTLTNVNKTLSTISTGKDRSFACSRTGAILVSERFNITLTNLRVQAFMSTDDFSTPDHCAIDQETTDLIPIIIGAALAALVIIVLIAYLIGRARANTPSYDNMK